MDCIFGPCRRLRRRWARLARRLSGPPVPAHVENALFLKATLPRTRATRNPRVKRSIRQRGADPLEAFFQMLVEAVDRNTAKKAIEEELRNTIQALDRTNKEFDELNCHHAFVVSKAVAVPALQPAIDTQSVQLKQQQELIDEHIGTNDLLKRRLLQSQCQLNDLYRRIYDSSDAFLDSVDHDGNWTGTAFDQSQQTLKVSKDFTASLRMSRDCFLQIVIPSFQSLRERRKEYLKTSRSMQAKESQSHAIGVEREKKQALEMLQRHEDRYKMQRAQQDKREQRILEDHAQPFLVASKKISSDRRPSQASSTSGIEGLTERPKEIWTGLQTFPKIPEDSLYLDTEGAQALRQGRHGVKSTHKSIETLQSQYMYSLANYVYNNPTATKMDFDATWARDTGNQYDAWLKMYQDSLAAWQDFYDTRLGNVTSGEKDGVILAHWAAATEDDPPDQSPTIKYEMASPRRRERSRKLRKYGRTVARREPYLVSPSRSPTKPAGSNPALTVGDDDVWIEHDVVGGISQQERAKRLQRLNRVAQELRQQFKQDYGLHYVRSPMMAT